MLELGCGTDNWTALFCRQNFQVMAIDGSEAMLDIAESKKIKNALSKSLLLNIMRVIVLPT